MFKLLSSILNVDAIYCIDNNNRTHCYMYLLLLFVYTLNIIFFNKLSIIYWLTKILNNILFCLLEKINICVMIK